MKKCLSSCIVFVSLLVASSSVPQAQADVKLPKVIGSHMVLQRDRPLPIWGWADPGEEVTVKLDEATATAKADAQGNWKVVLPAVKADGKAHSMTVSGKNKIELDDILIGDVWIGSGQSNMEMGIAACERPRRRSPPRTTRRSGCCWCRRCRHGQPAKDVKADWVGVQPQDRCRRRLGRLLGRALLLRPAAAQGIGRAGRADRQLLGRIAHRALDGLRGERRRDVQRHDRPREAAGHPRRDLVSGRNERRQTA